MTAGSQNPVRSANNSILVVGWLLRVGGVAVLLSAFLSHAQVGKATEYEVKAAYLFNFGKFVKWPANVSGGDSFPICILGNDPFGNALDATVSGEAIDGKRISVRRVDNPSEAINCRIVFISASEASRLREIMPVLSRAPVLTVSDLPNFVRNHGVIQFVRTDDRVRFQVNLTAAEKAGLTLSSELLKVATDVKREGQAGE
jgi:YfiR/HmsC-like